MDSTHVSERPPGGIHRSRYKAKVAFVSPPSRRHAFQEHDACFLGVSLENSNFTSLKLGGMLEWISRRFDRCTVLIGDGIHRITLESTRSMPPGEARAEALRLGRQYIETNEHVFDVFKNEAELTMVTCSEVQAWPSYEAYHQRLCNYFDSDSVFRASVERFSRGYHSRRSEGLPAAEQEHRVNRSCDYFLEEFAIFCCLKQRGLSVMVYPGSFSTLTEIASGTHSRAPAELRDLTVVSLDLKGR